MVVAPPLATVTSELPSRNFSAGERVIKEDQEDKELIAKREMVAWVKLQRILAKYRQKIILEERLKAYRYDKKVEYTTIECRKSITVVERVPLKPTEYIPYNLSTEFKYSQEVLDNYKGKLRTKKPLFLHLYSKDTLQVNMNQFIEDLSTKLKVKSEELPHALTHKKYHGELREMIIVIPKLYIFGEKYLRKINAFDYAQNFNYYKLDSIFLLDFIHQHLKDKEISMGDLKELLVVIGQPMTIAERKSLKSPKRKIVVEAGGAKRNEGVEFADDDYEEDKEYRTEESNLPAEKIHKHGRRRSYEIEEGEVIKPSYKAKDKHEINFTKKVKERNRSNEEVRKSKGYEPSERVRPEYIKKEEYKRGPSKTKEKGNEELARNNYREDKKHYEENVKPSKEDNKSNRENERVNKKEYDNVKQENTYKKKSNERPYVKDKSEERITNNRKDAPTHTNERNTYKHSKDKTIKQSTEPREHIKQDSATNKANKDIPKHHKEDNGEKDKDVVKPVECHKERVKQVESKDEQNITNKSEVQEERQQEKVDSKVISKKKKHKKIIKENIKEKKAINAGTTNEQPETVLQEDKLNSSEGEIISKINQKQKEGNYEEVLHEKKVEKEDTEEELASKIDIKEVRKEPVEKKEPIEEKEVEKEKSIEVKETENFQSPHKYTIWKEDKSEDEADNETEKKMEKHVYREINEDDEELRQYDEEFKEQIDKVEEKPIVKPKATLKSLFKVKEKTESIEKTEKTEPKKIAPPKSSNKIRTEVADLEEEYNKLIEQLKKEDEEKLKQEEERKKKLLEAERKKEEPEEKKPELIEEPTEEEINQMMINKFITKFNKDYDLKGIMKQLSDEDIEKLGTVNDAMSAFLNQGEFPELYKSKLRESHFTPFIDFSEENLKRLFEDSNTGGANQKGSENDWIEFKEKLMKLRLSTNYRKGGPLSGIIRCEDVVNKDPNDKAPIEFDKKFLALTEIEDKPAMSSADRFKLLEEKFMILNGLKKEEVEKEEVVESIPEVNKEEPLALNQVPSVMDEKSELKLPEVLKKYKVNISMIEKRDEMSKLEIIERRCKIMDKQAI